MWRHHLEFFFPVDIINPRPGELVIDDHRPSDSLLLAVGLALGALFISAVLFRPLIDSGIYWPVALFLLPAPICGVWSLLVPFRETYVFNKRQGTYTFTRRSVLKRETREGDLSQVRAVQMLRGTVTTSEEGTKEYFRVALLLQQGLLFGMSDTLVLREETPIMSRYESEARIAYAIADFLQVPVPEMADVAP